MPPIRFTARRINAIKPPTHEREEYFDEGDSGLGLRVAPSGRKTWFVMYRIHGRQRRLTLGTFPALSLADARQKALEAKRAVLQGTDPADQKQQARHAPRFADLAEEYLAKHAKVHKKSWREDERLLRKEVLPTWGTRQAADITRRDVIALLDALVARGAPIEANRVLSLVRKMFHWAISRELLEHTPCVQIEPPGKEQARERVLTEEEIRAVWQAFEQLGPVLSAYFESVKGLVIRVTDHHRHSHGISQTAPS